MTAVADPAERLDQAALNAVPMTQLTVQDPDLTTEAAYGIQAALIGRRVSRGEHVVGVKMGLTSQAKMAQVGVHEMIFGVLTDEMQVREGSTVQVGRFIQPRIEPEIAFLLRDGGIVAAAPALEIIDSRYADFEFTAPDVIADNASAAAFVVGVWQPIPSGLDNLGVLLEVDGQVVQVGSSAAILGDPWRAFAAGVDLAARHGIELEDDWVFLAGAATAAVPLKAGLHVRAVIEKLGSATVRT